MPGLLAHVAAGVFIGVAAINFMDIPQDWWVKFMIFCVFMSCLPDVFYPLIGMGVISYADYLKTWLQIGHIVIPVLALLALYYLLDQVDIPNENLIMVGLVCVLVHVAFDPIIPNKGILV